MTITLYYNFKKKFQCLHIGIEIKMAKTDTLEKLSPEISSPSEILRKIIKIYIISSFLQFFKFK